MLKLKIGVNPTGIKAELLFVIMVVNEVYRDRGSDCVVTSLNDSTHSVTSRHYQGCAVDFRTRNLLNDGIAREITKEIRERLGRHYMVLFERNHIHVSYKPRKP